MQFKIPQEVQIEDRIIWVLSIKDLIIMGVGGGIAYVAFLSLDPQTWPFISIPIALFTLAVVFVKISNMTFSKWIYSILLYFILPQKRVWKNMSNDPLLMDQILNPKKKEVKTDDNITEKLLKQKKETFSKLQDISSILDQERKEQELGTEELKDIKKEKHSIIKEEGAKKEENMEETDEIEKKKEKKEALDAIIHPQKK